MSLKNGLIILTLVSVVADTMLLPFYPQFFRIEFNQHSPEHVGYYIAACCFTVMVTFPLWAKVAKVINEFHLWVYTQIVAGALGVACYFVDSLLGFWLLSQTMLVFKASYLLIYPLVMRLESEDKHLGVAGLFSILMHFGAIGGAVAGGSMIEYIQPRGVYLIMASTDVLQVLVCLYIIFKRREPFFQADYIARRKNSGGLVADTHTKPRWQATAYIISLCSVSLLFYFSAFSIRPFFSIYWQQASGLGSETIAALVYSIPGWVALFGLWYNQRQKGPINHYRTMFNSFFLALIGVFMQANEQLIVIVLGRCVFAWALFQITVRLEVVLFENSQQRDFGLDFSKLHLAQNIGILIASFSVGYLVSFLNVKTTFWLSMAGFSLTLVAYVVLFRSHIWSSDSKLKEIQSV